MNESNILTRRELYELIWSKPLTALSKEYAYSDNGLRKICIKHNIPLPKSGYWSIVRFNKKVEKDSLPKDDNSEKIELYIRKNDQKSINYPVLERVKIRQEIENSKELPLIVPNTLSKPHIYIKATRVYHEKLKIRNKKRDWDMHLDKTNVVSINVSDNVFSRGLRFMDTLIKAVEARGHKITAFNETTIIVKEQSYNLRLTEKNRRVKKETNRSWDEYDLVPTGSLCLKLDDSYPIKEWSDSKTKPIELKLADILTWIELRAKEDRETEIANAIWREKQEKLREKEKALRKEKEDELEKFKNLFESATRYHKTVYIRNYIDRFESFTIENGNLDEENRKWIHWAREKADWYDPFIEKQDNLLDGIDRDDIENIKLNRWRF
jgi:hypothetical protein